MCRQLKARTLARGVLCRGRILRGALFWRWDIQVYLGVGPGGPPAPRRKWSAPQSEPDYPCQGTLWDQPQFMLFCY